MQNKIDLENTKNLILEFRDDRNYQKYVLLACADDTTILNLIDLCRETKYPFPQYSSWLMAHIADSVFEKIYPFHHKIIDVFLEIEDPSAKRNLANVLLKFPKTTYKEGLLLDALFQLLQNPDTKVALKAYTMYLLIDFIKAFPELKSEFIAVINEGIEKESAAYSGAAKKTLKKISKI